MTTQSLTEHYNNHPMSSVSPNDGQILARITSDTRAEHAKKVDEAFAKLWDTDVMKELVIVAREGKDSHTRHFCSDFFKPFAASDFEEFVERKGVSCSVSWNIDRTGWVFEFSWQCVIPASSSS